jgi:hypothetical protein
MARRDVGPHIVVADDAEDLHFTEAGHGDSLRFASLRALHCGHMREDAEVMGRLEPPSFSPKVRMIARSAVRLRRRPSFAVVARVSRCLLAA